MNDIVEELSDNYSLAQQAGQKELSRSWKRLRSDTRAWLASTGHYDDRGAPIEAECCEPAVEDLEYNLGLINRCIAAKLPGPLESGEPIPQEALDSDVLEALSALMHHPRGQDPVFLRRALLALRCYEMAHLVSNLPAAKQHSIWRGAGTLAFWLFCLTLVLMTPAIVAEALVSAAKGSYRDTSAALYGLGFIAWMLNISMNLGKSAPKTKDEQSYYAWGSLGWTGSGDWTVGGAGATEYFEAMVRKGLYVRPIAFDICESLKMQTLR